MAVLVVLLWQYLGLRLSGWTSKMNVKHLLIAAWNLFWSIIKFQNVQMFQKSLKIFWKVFAGTAKTSPKIAKVFFLCDGKNRQEILFSYFSIWNLFLQHLLVVSRVQRLRKLIYTYTFNFLNICNARRMIWSFTSNNWDACLKHEDCCEPWFF